MFKSAKGKQQKQARQLQCQEQCIDHVPYYLFGIVACTFFPTTFREIAVEQGYNTLSLPPIFCFSCKIPGGKQGAFWEMCKSRIPISAQTYCQLRGMAWYGQASTLDMYTTKPPRQWQPWIAAVDIYRVPRRLSIEENVRAKEGGKETTGETALRLPSVPFPWSLVVHHQSLMFRVRLYGAKNEAPEEEAELVLFRKDPRNPGEYQQNFIRGGSRPP